MSFREDRFGLVLITSSLVVITLICGLHLTSQLNARRDQDRALGLSMVQLLSKIPFERLVPAPGQQGPIDVFKTSQSNEDFAYAAIVTTDGRALATAVSPGVIVPIAPIREEPSEWTGERVLSSSDGRPIREFIAPVLVEGRRAAHVRIGFLDPGYAAFLDQASFLGMLALPIFLLTPLAYFLIRRGVRPLVAACANLNELVESQSFDTVQIEATGEVGEFISGFNKFMALAKERVEVLEKGKAEIVASSKVAAFQKNRIEGVLASLPDATLVLDETGTAIFANPRLEAVLGIHPDRVVGRKPEEWCTHSKVLDHLAGCRGRSAQQSLSSEIELGEDSGVERALLTTRPLMSQDGSSTIVGTLVIFHDVSSEVVGRHAQDEFVSQMAHELKAPLHVMSMYSESLLGEQGSSEEFRVETSNVIRDEVERLASLINTLLSIARIEAGAVAIRRDPVRLEEFLEDTTNAVARSAADMNLQFSVDVPKDVSAIFAEKDLLRVAISNLLTNAIKYNHEGGEVGVSVEETKTRTTIRIRDTGIGIAPEDLPRVFEKFYRSDHEETQKRQGHGLGLSLAKEIVELHGGSIRVESVVGEGSEFAVVLRKRAERGGSET